MLRPRLAALLLVAAVSTTACDRTPVDPGQQADFTAILFGDDVAALTSVPLSLPALVQSAVFKVYSEHGAGAARAMVTDLRRLQQQALTAAATSDRESADRHERALHAEQLGIVLRVYGDDAAVQVIAGVQDELERLGQELSAAHDEGREVEAADELLAEVRQLLKDATAAAENHAARVALDAATRAAALTERVRHAIDESRRLPGLDDLFASAVRRLHTERGVDAAAATMAPLATLRDAASAAVRDGDRHEAHDALTAVRREQIRIVIDALGEQAVARMLSAATAAMAEIDTAGAGRDAPRLARMSAAARDLVERAGAALDARDPDLALDLGGHAVSLINLMNRAR